MGRLLPWLLFTAVGQARAADCLAHGIHAEPLCQDGGEGADGGLGLLQQSSARALLSARQSDRRQKAPVDGPFGSRKVCHEVDAGVSQCYPDLMFVGVSKCGSTSIVAAMLAHPQVIMQTQDEGKSGWSVDSATDSRFVINGDKNFVWEAHVLDAHTKSDAQLEKLNWHSAPRIPTADVGKYLQLHYTPNYFYYPDTPFHIVDLYPNSQTMKYFVIVREPVRRAVSSWKYHRQLTFEQRSFEQVVDDGLKQRQVLEACYNSELSSAATSGGSRAQTVEGLPVDAQREVLNRCFWGQPDSHDRTLPMETPLTLMHAHVDKGIYVDQLRRWQALVGRDNVFILSLEEWAADSAAWYAKIAAFAGYEAVGPDGFKSPADLEAVLEQDFNSGGDGAAEPPEPGAALKRRLAEFYKPYNEELFALVGRRLWNDAQY